MFVPTLRLLLIALAGAAAVVLAGGHAAALVVAVLWMLGVLVAGIIDSRLVPSAEQTVWSRTHDDKLSLGAWNVVEVSLRNTGGRPLSFQVRDAVPQLLVVRGESGRGQIQPGQDWSIAYRVYPLHRGDYELGPLSVRYLGPLGLAWRQLRIKSIDPVRVYPNLLAVREYETLIRAGRLADIGLHRSRRWGEGTEFERVRSYSTDDEFRRISWKATARRGAPMVIDYETERSQHIILGIDAGRLMSARVPLPERVLAGEAPPDRVPPLTRLDYALNTSLLLAFVAQQYGDRVGTIAFGDHVLRFIPPRPGRRQFVLLTEALYNVEPLSVETDFAAAIGHLAARSSRRSLVVLFADFTDRETSSALVAQLSQLARRHLPLLVTLRDPETHRLAHLPPAGSQSVYERAVARRVLDDREQTLSALRRQGVLTLDVPADKLSASVINRYLEIKGRSLL